ncbi:Glycosyltransferase involved in cell wall bisynthesis [Salinimicrobium sediminis]|uniref:Glycosyltransferase involved in cell wall bisynthesis n=1 Tax=Salinimicrobium sediminis TaxID=1343891 RepID=A0A285X4P8_9FLAO|nr:glycosyltransferase [Salinimicrobium sediminis]SOC80327.1 Glycosyltransferase involved in cell wall bisynthesis [Salinimicrobium sediminis]
MKPLFSIIIPNYNREETICRAINSVLKQTETNFELIVVDDLSSDNSVELIKKSFNDKRIKLIELAKNGGASKARNIGIKASQGELISLLDSDDEFEETFLEVSKNVLRSSGPEIGFMWTGVTYVYPHKSYSFSWVPKRRGEAYTTFLHNLQVGSGAGITFKKEVFLLAGFFNEDLPAAEDTEFFLRISQKFDYTYTEKHLIKIYKGNKDRLSGNFFKIAEAYNIFLPKHFKRIDKDENLQKKFYYKMMWLNMHLLDKATAERYLKKIPKKKWSDTFKYYFTFYLYSTFPLKFASRLHIFLSK